MNEHGVRLLLAELGQTKLKKNKGWINTFCPLAEFTHGGGEDQHPSFGISINDVGWSYYHCFGCADKPQPLGRLLHNLFVMSGSNPVEVSAIYTKYEVFDREEKMVIPDVWEIEKEVAAPLPAEVLVKYPLLQGARDVEANLIRRWLERDRGVPEWVQNLFRLRYNPRNGTVIFPLTNVHGDIFLMRERLRTTKKIWTVSPEVARTPNLTFPSLTNVGAWFGMFLVDWQRPVILVEGEIDAMRLMALNPLLNAVASATSSVTEAQIEALSTSVLLSGYDADVAGEKAHKRIVKMMAGRATMFKLDWSRATKEDGKPCKDPGDLQSISDLTTVFDAVELV